MTISLSPFTWGALIAFAVIGVFNVINDNFDIIGNKRLQDKIIQMKVDNKYREGVIGALNCSSLSILEKYMKNTQTCKEYHIILDIK